MDFAPTRGVGQRPANKRKAGGGFADDQTNAMLATSKEVFSPCRTPARPFGHKRPNTAFLLPCGSLLATPGNRPQIAAQRSGRVNRVDRRDTLGIVTFGTVQLNEPPSIAAAHHSGNADFP